ncbi:hypothetical protein AB4587_07280 [Vibrio breoganii]
MILDDGSFRDPSGYVVHNQGKIYRIINPIAIERYGELKNSGLLEKLITNKMLVNTWNVSSDHLPGMSNCLIVEHEKIPIITYPYEWTPTQLKSAAIFHLDLHLFLLDHDWHLSDATAYNVQFDPHSGNPIFIDLLSIEPYIEGEYWAGHNQFCEQFLNPLILYCKLKIPFNDIYKGTMKGVSSLHTNRMLPISKYFSPTLLTNIVLPSRIQSNSTNKGIKNSTQLNKVAKPLPKIALQNILMNLKGYILNLETVHKYKSTWSNYEIDKTYTESSNKIKVGFIKDFCSEVKPNVLWDIGCNSGEFSQVAFESGAKSIIGIDGDIEALNTAYSRFKSTDYCFTPIYSDLSNPSPNIGWNLKERSELTKRSKPDSILALALLHHLVIGSNIPMKSVISWILSLSSRGVIEFVGKDDETVIEMLTFREDIFSDYHVDNFREIISKDAKIVKEHKIPNSDRVIFWYEVI